MTRPAAASVPSVPTTANAAAPGADGVAAREDARHLGLSAWAAASGRGGFLYTAAGSHFVTAGLPRGASANRAALFDEFAAACRREGRRPLHFGLTDAAFEFLPAARPRARWRIGNLPVFELARWRDAAAVPRGIRAQARRARNHGVTVRHLEAAPSNPGLRAALAACRDAWLRAKPLPPLGFMTTPFLFEPWPADGVFVAEHAGRVAGFLTASRAVYGAVLRVDAVARAPGAPNGCAELLVSEAFRHAAARGVAQATLGLAPLSRRGIAARGAARGWPDRASALARRLGAPFYSFAGLEAFKAKFDPDAWVPLYCVAPGRRFAARDMLAVARAFAGGSLRAYAVRAVAWRLGAAERRAV